ncbi:hypothetical protein EDD15DRAFT_2124614, partial [Pisolithus albus]
LLCWVRSEDPEAVFTVKVCGAENVGSLKKILKRERSDTFRGVDAYQLTLYPLFVPSNADRAVELGKWRSHDKEELDFDQRIDQVLPKRPDGEWVVVV